MTTSNQCYQWRKDMKDIQQQLKFASVKIEISRIYLLEQYIGEMSRILDSLLEDREKFLSNKS